MPYKAGNGRQCPPYYYYYYARIRIAVNKLNGVKMYKNIVGSERLSAYYELWLLKKCIKIIFLQSDI